MKKRNRSWKAPRRLWLCLALGGVTLALFLPALTHSFLGYDDQQYVTENRHVQAGLSWPGAVWAFGSLYANNWHPVTWLSHMLDCQLYGLHPDGHHLTNVLLHVANTLLLFLLLRRLTGAEWRSAAVAALFAWHPLHVESVAWVAERKDVLSGLFFLLTLLAYAAYVSRVSRGWCGEEREPGAGQFGPSSIRYSASGFYLLALVLFALGLMSKPMVVTLPFVLLLLDYWPLRRLEVKDQRSKIKNCFFLLGEKVPFLALSAGCCALTVEAQRQGYALVSAGSLPTGSRAGHALVSYVHYLGAMVLPRHLAVYYPYPAREGSVEELGAGILLALVSVAVWRLRRRPYLAVGWLWYVGMLVPVIGLVQVGDQAWADRYTYLPLIGLFVAFVWAVGDWVGFESSSPSIFGLFSRTRTRAKTIETAAERIGSRGGLGRVLLRQRLMMVLGAGLAVALLAGSSLQLRYWKNTRTLFEHAARVTSHNGRALTVLGSLLAEQGRLEPAMNLYRQALSYDPNNPRAHFFLGRALELQGKPDEAVAEYTKALWFKPLQEKTHVFLGVLLAKQGRLEEAAAHYRAALALDPESATAENDLARLLHSEGRLDEAIAHYRAALRFDPTLAQAHNNLGVLLLQKGRVAEGAAQLEEAVRLNPGDRESQYNLALALNQQQRWQEAAALLARLAPARPQDARLCYQFGLALAHLKRTREAMSRYAQALLVRSDFPEALDGLAWLLATDCRAGFRNGTEAVRMAERACELTGRKNAGMLATLGAAYAEAGRFPEAAAAAQKGWNLAKSAGPKEAADRCQAVLQAARAGKPWREAN